MDIGWVYFHDMRMDIILALIGIHIVSTIAAAIKDGYFDWRVLADFYRQNVIPYILGYFVVYVATDLVAGLDTFLGQISATVFFGFIATSLVAKILGSWRDMGLPLESRSPRSTQRQMEY